MNITDDQKKAHLLELEHNPVLQHIFVEMRQSYINAWEHSGDPGVREESWFNLKALEAVKAEIGTQLTKLMEGG